ncbi:hypothetical protein GYA13_00610 [Candidatus Kuenenbacteria bacterium]|nr:hypothetical protein [Candidatus Kuenenbacteria bacterium]
MALFRKLFIPSKEARVYTISLVAFFVILLAFIREDSFFSMSYIVVYMVPPIAFLSWAITIIVCKLIAEVLVRIQMKILPNNQKIFSAIFIVVLSVILFFSFARIFSSLAVKVMPFNFICQRSMDFEGDQDRCYQQLALKKNDPQICQAGSSFLLVKCHAQLAIKNNDLKICDLLPGYSYDDYYQAECYSKVAIYKNDLTICDLSKDRAGCYVSFAAAKKDANVCEQMVDFADSEELDRCRLNVLNIR